MWKSTVPTTMQGFGDYCKNMVQDNGSNGNSISITLRDTRDNNTYTVAKLKDGKCWMTQNLRIGSNQKSTILSSNDSDVENNYTLPMGGTVWSNSYGIAYTYIDSNATYGGFYNWHAATAQSISSSARADAPYSICPKGWKLPTYNDGLTFTSKYSNTDMTRPPLNFTTLGTYFYTGGTPSYGDNYGSLWLGTGGESGNVCGGQCAYNIGFMTWSPTVFYNYTFQGTPIRCISR